MSDPEILPPAEPAIPPQAEAEEPGKGPSLSLLYGLLAVAFAAAIAFALLIVRPFYVRR